MQKYQTYLLINMIIKVCVKQSTTTSSVLQFNILVFMFDLVFPESPKMFSKYTILCTILFNILYICTYTFNISRKAVFIQTINNFPINEIHLCEFFHNFTISNSNLISSKMNPRAKRLLLFLFSHLVQSSPALYMYIVAAGFRVVGKGRCRVAISCDRIGWSRGHDNYPSCQQHVEPPCLRKTMPGSPYDFRLAPTNRAWPNEPSPSTMLNHPPVSSSLLQSPRLIRDLPQED